MSAKVRLGGHRMGLGLALTLCLGLTAPSAAVAVPDYDGDGAVGGDCAPLDGNVAPGKLDKPDLSFRDTNCDGIDGTESKAVFVALSGNNAAPGTRANPKRTITAAIVAAKASGKDVYIAGGTYDEQVQPEDGVGLYGGYSPGSGQRSPAELTTIAQTDKEALLADGDEKVVLQLLTLQETVTGAAPAGFSSYAVRIVNGSTVALDGVKTVVGAARAGQDAPAVARAADGIPGSNGGAGWYTNSDCVFGGINCPGLGGVGGSGGRSGGTGGNGAFGFSPGSNGAVGGGDFGGAFGAGGCLTNCTGDGANGSNATASGTPGGAGDGAGFTTANAGDTWTNGAVAPDVATAGGGGTAGFGGGGGGGGRGGTDCNGLTFYGGGGAGGGGGGQGGGGGAGGGNGGGSFGVYIHNAQLVVSGTSAIQARLAAGNGGKGGTGAKGGDPGNGMYPGDGPQPGSAACGERISAGGNGGYGSAGGAGGSGGGGAGGPSAGVFKAGTAKYVLKSGVQTLAGTAGAGGVAGTGAPADASGDPGAKGGVLPVGSANATDTDFDGDDVKDVSDACPTIARGTGGTADGCVKPGTVLADADGDGIPDSADDCATTPRGNDANEDGCPDPTGGGAGPARPAAPTLIPSTIANKWLAFPKYTKVSGLSVTNVPAGATVNATCKTKKRKQQRKACPYKTRTIRTAVSRARLSLSKPFRKRKLPIGTQITIQITAPGQIGKQIRYTVRPRAVPKVSNLCIPPGGKPGRCV